jgi:Na+/H+ antiporter NhaD/arsenite permease-like protein
MSEYYAISVFLLVFVFICWEVFDKSLVALSGALLLILLGVLTPEEAVSSIEYSTIFLLLGMMIIVNIASKSGVFQLLNTRFVAFTRGNPLLIFILFCLMTGFLSAFLDNVTTVLLIVPLTIELLRGIGRDPRPYIFGEILFANIGGTLTLIGDPPNIIIGEVVGLSFTDFIVNLWVPILGVSIFTLLVTIVVYWKKIKPITKDLLELHVANILIKKIKHKFLKTTLHKDFVIKVVGVVLLTITGFLLSSYLGLPNYVIALTGAIFLAIVTSRRIDVHEAFRSVEWDTLFFFAGLFVVVKGVEQAGYLVMISDFIAASTTNVMYLSLIILWVSGIVSMFVNNIPFVAVMIPVIFGIQNSLGTADTAILWWALSLGVCLGGNGTMIGASANVISIDLARKDGIKISFLDYMKFAMPVTFGGFIVCSIYLILKTM